MTLEAPPSHSCLCLGPLTRWRGRGRGRGSVAGGAGGWRGRGVAGGGGRPSSLWPSCLPAAAGFVSLSRVLWPHPRQAWGPVPTAGSGLQEEPPRALTPYPPPPAPAPGPCPGWPSPCHSWLSCTRPQQGWCPCEGHTPEAPDGSLPVPGRAGPHPSCAALPGTSPSASRPWLSLQRFRTGHSAGALRHR